MPTDTDLHDDDLDNEDFDDTDSTDPSDLVKRLRRQIRDRDKELKELRPLRDEVTPLRQEKALREAGLELNPKQMKALFASHEGEMTTEALHASAVELGFAVEREADVESADLDTHDEIDRASLGSGEPRQGGSITPAEAVSWPIDKSRRFMDAHPDKWEALLRGETVKGIQF